MGDTNIEEDRTQDMKLSEQITPLATPASSSKNQPDFSLKDYIPSESFKSGKSIYVKDAAPQFYSIEANSVSSSIAPKGLPGVFSTLLLPGQPELKDDLPKLQMERIRTFVGSDLTEKEFEKLASICSPEHLRTGLELGVSTDYPNTCSAPTQNDIHNVNNFGDNLCIVKNAKARQNHEENTYYIKRLKYRGMKLIPLQECEENINEGPTLTPGEDLLYRIRLYRPTKQNPRDRKVWKRHSRLTCDMVLAGCQPLTALRDSIVCANDVSIKVDVSLDRDNLVNTLPSAKELFPSALLFINNRFFVDDRDGCKDYSKVIRKWALERDLGDYPAYKMSSVKIEDLVIRLGHPDLFMHQGNCEHTLVFSEVRVMGWGDPRTGFPRHSLVSQNQTVYCTTCAEFGARWVVTQSCRVPFDPAFFCDTCLRLYMYRGGTKVGSFKAYAYRGNEINFLKPTATDL